jgi:molybdate transport system regulatory protein
MAANPTSLWAEGWSIGVRVWAERAGKAVLGPGRLELLQQIERHRSITGAARQMAMSYRRAWELVQSINSAAGKPLIEAAAGGSGGGGAVLTTLGRQTVAVFRTLTDQLTRTAAELVRVADPHTLHLLAAVSLEEVVGRVLTDYALIRPDVRVRAVFGASDELAALIRTGTRADLFLTADPRLLDRFRPRPTQHVALATNALALIAPAASSLAAGRPISLLRRTGLRVALAVPECPLGAYTARYLSAAKLASIAATRTVRAENSRSVVAAVRSGQADVGIVYASDAARADGCRILCRIDPLTPPICYEAAVIGTGSDESPAAHLLNYLISIPAATRFRECGFRPAPQS